MAADSESAERAAQRQPAGRLLQRLRAAIGSIASATFSAANIAAAGSAGLAVCPGSFRYPANGRARLTGDPHQAGSIRSINPPARTFLWSYNAGVYCS